MGEAGKQAKALPTGQMFTPGLSLFLRFERFGSKHMLPVTCQGYNQQSGVLQVGWSSQAAERCEPPESGTPLACLTMHDGVLVTVTGALLDKSEGKLPRMRIQASKQCVGVNLRRHPRYEVTARFCFGESLKHLNYFQNVPRTLNLSIGGFGGEIPRKAWPDLERLGYRLELFEQAKPAENAEPSLILEGYALVRKVVEQAGGAMVYIGCQFEELSPSQATEIDLWLAAYTAGQREA